MDDKRWIGWVAVIIVFVVFRVLQAAFKGRAGSGNSMARLNAAAQRILQQKAAEAQAQPRPTKHTTAKQPWQAAKAQPRQSAQNQPRNQAAHAPRPVTAPNSPAVIRRGGILSAGSEPVIQRRR